MDISVPTKQRKKRKIENNGEHEDNTVAKTMSTREDAGGDFPQTVSIAARGINVSEFIEARALEIKNMTNALNESTSGKGKRAFQMIPRHMRRRAASHDVRRIPRRLRDKARAEVATTPSKATKRPSRKYRRRPSCLLEEYNRRQRRQMWLETHIWHAKRFKMIEKWGFKIPNEPCDKSFRATYRASSTGCLIQDCSFMATIELTGNELTMLDGLKQLTSRETGLTFASKATLSGTREGSLVMYRKHMYPFKAIGPVTFLWRPRCSSNATNPDLPRALWITCHPSIKEELLEGLRSVFPVADIPSETDPVQNAKHADDVAVVDRHMEFVRFSLRGELSHSVLVNALDLCNDVVSTGERWWQTYYADENHRRNLDSQHVLWKQCRIASTASAFPSGVVIALTVSDPRLTTPMKKRWPPNDESSVLGGSHDSEMLLPDVLKTWPHDVHHSPIWDLEVRRTVRCDHVTVGEINTIRSKQLVPGSSLELGDGAARVPLLLVNKSGFQSCTSGGINPDYGCGWDVILPPGWGRELWINFIYQGARAGGLRESTNMHIEACLPHFPEHFVDTAAGKHHLDEVAVALETKHLRYPPDKRVAHKHLGISHPFAPPVAELVRCWSAVAKSQETVLVSCQNDDATEQQENPRVAVNDMQSNEDSFYVLRKVSLLNELSSLITRPRSVSGQTELTASRDRLCGKLTTDHGNALLKMCINSIGKGCPSDNALIALPTLSDLEEFERNNSFAPLEVPHKGRKNAFPSIGKATAVGNVAGLSGNCTRWTIGFVTAARYCLSLGRGMGLSHVTSHGFARLARSQTAGKRLIVLYRNINTLQYRFAYADVLSS